MIQALPPLSNRRTPPLIGTGEELLPTFPVPVVKLTEPIKLPGPPSIPIVILPVPAAVKEIAGTLVLSPTVFSRSIPALLPDWACRVIELVASTPLEELPAVNKPFGMLSVTVRLSAKVLVVTTVTDWLSVMNTPPTPESDTWTLAAEVAIGDPLVPIAPAPTSSRRLVDRVPAVHEILVLAPPMLISCGAKTLAFKVTFPGESNSY